MTTPYKIVINEIKFHLADNPLTFNINSIKSKKVLTVQYKSQKSLRKIVMNSALLKVDNIIIYHDSIDELKILFFESFKKITAAGGLVINEEGEILFIFRNDKWDLPKGKLESEELIDIAAIREVEEETGIDVTRIVNKIIVTYHTYVQNKEKILKENHWYLMNAEKNQLLVPQIEENITLVEWIPISKLDKIYSNSYSSIKKVILKYLKSIKQVD
jgi:8-oxo-(d)GTP phosphatase